MARPIIVDGAERVACPKCNHGFALSEGISRQAIGQESLAQLDTIAPLPLPLKEEVES
jgi:hypothetical protein